MKTAALLLPCLALASIGVAQVNTVQTLAPGIYAHQGDNRQGHSNNGWVVFEDYTVVIDANYPSGAAEVLPKVRASTDKPLRFVIDTHHHGDHAYGNQFWASEGATLVAHKAAVEILRQSGLADYAASASRRPDVRASKLNIPSLQYPDTLVFDDGQRRLELHWLGVAHTKGDTFLWLPKEKILFTGDACVNGAFNMIRDGDTAEWIKTLERAKQFGAEKVVPGHGPVGGPEILADQQSYVIELRRGLQALIDAKKSTADIRAALPALAAELKQKPNIARYVPGNLSAHAEKIHTEMTGKPLSP